MGLFTETFDKAKFKANLKMAVTRLNLQKAKTQNNIKLTKKQISDLLRQGKDESARIKVENVIREDYTIEAFELVELFCDLLLSRLQLIAEARTCPHDLKEGVSTLIWAAPRLEVQELMEVRKQLALKFGKDFAISAMENKELAVNQRVMFKLGVKVPEPYLCIQYLKEIAREFNVDWDDPNALAAVNVNLPGIDIRPDVPIENLDALSRFPDANPTHAPPPPQNMGYNPDLAPGAPYRNNSNNNNNNNNYGGGGGGGGGAGYGGNGGFNNNGGGGGYNNGGGGSGGYGGGGGYTGGSSNMGNAPPITRFDLDSGPAPSARYMPDNLNSGTLYPGMDPVTQKLFGSGILPTTAPPPPPPTDLNNAFSVEHTGNAPPAHMDQTTIDPWMINSGGPRPVLSGMGFPDQSAAAAAAPPPPPASVAPPPAAAPSYDFDDLQARFEALKKRE